MLLSDGGVCGDGDGGGVCGGDGGDGGGDGGDGDDGGDDGGGGGALQPQSLKLLSLK